MKKPQKPNMRKKKLRCLVFFASGVIICLMHFLGVSDYMRAINYETEFNYPLEIDIMPAVREVLSGKKPSITPINRYPYRFLTNSGKCKTLEKLDLFIVVKSAMGNFGHRMAIRQTYGQENSIPGRIVRTLFFLGTEESPSHTQKYIDEEKARYKDIIQIDFRDNYYNNTIKSMMSFRWLYEHCPIADYYFFTDDDMYVSVNNILNYVQDIELQKLKDFVDLKSDSINDEDKVDEHLLAGYVFKSRPLRPKLSKWYVSLEEYPWDKWPPYVTAGAYIVCNKTMKLIYAGSLFVKHFRFDDIYLAIVAKKVNVVPRHCPNIYFYKKRYTKEDYKDVIASHGYDDHEELIRVWNEQNSFT